VLLSSDLTKIVEALAKIRGGKTSVLRDRSFPSNGALNFKKYLDYTNKITAEVYPYSSMALSPVMHREEQFNSVKAHEYRSGTRVYINNGREERSVCPD
jgi:hypothetical protein